VQQLQIQATNPSSGSPFATAAASAVDAAGTYSASTGGPTVDAGVAQAAASDATRMREENHTLDRALAALVTDLQAKDEQVEQLALDVSKYKQGMVELGATRVGSST
jgi:hypothetical protein